MPPRDEDISLAIKYLTETRCINKSIVEDFVDKDLMIKFLKEDIKNKFAKKGREVVDANIKAVDLVSDNIKQITITKTDKKEKQVNTFYDKIMSMLRFFYLFDIRYART